VQARTVLLGVLLFSVFYYSRCFIILGVFILRGKWFFQLRFAEASVTGAQSIPSSRRCGRSDSDSARGAPARPAGPHD